MESESNPNPFRLEHSALIRNGYSSEVALATVNVLIALEDPRNEEREAAIIAQEAEEQRCSEHAITGAIEYLDMLSKKDYQGLAKVK